MQQIINFLIRNRYLLLFLLLEIIALIFIIQSHSYHKSKLITSSNSIIGGIYNKTNNLSNYFSLANENQKLAEENTYLKNLLSKKKINIDSVIRQVTDTVYHQEYQYITAKVINNSYSKRNNFLTINKGLKHGIQRDMGVILPNGIVGVIQDVSPNFATILSLLNENSKINVGVKNSNHFGTLAWNGKNYEEAQLLDFPRRASLKIGDTIVTGGKSVLFPEGIPVGTIKSLNLRNNYYENITVTLFTDMSNLGYVYIVNNIDKKEIENLEKKHE
ncbi:MAG TPA: rod shape-determining protein MreC [Flavobacteriaceae bacterium]|nr:rod shape-determining protein MreC [Flavobacteriaceae bacterium]HEX5742316.1 rod shape-determining protein MreC [Flavobacteriaceae bacterium]